MLCRVHGMVIMFIQFQMTERILAWMSFGIFSKIIPRFHAVYIDQESKYLNLTPFYEFLFLYFGVCVFVNFNFSLSRPSP